MSNDGSLKSRAVVAVAGSASSVVAVNGLRVAQFVMLANILSPAGFGAYAMAFPLVGIATLVADLGTGNAIVYRAVPGPRELAGLFLFNLASSLLLWAALVAAAPTVGRLFGSTEAGGLLGGLALLVPLGALAVVPQALLEKALRFRELALVDVAGASCNAAVSILAALGGAGVQALVWGALAGAVLRAVVLVVIARAWRFADPRKASFELGPYMRFGLPHAGQRLLNLGIASVDMVLIGAFLGAHAAGIYGLAQQFVLAVTGRINLVFGRVFFPLYAPLREDPARVRGGYLRLQAWTALVSLPALGGALAVAPQALPLIIGEQWLPATSLLAWLAVMGATRAIAGTVGPLLLVTGRTRLGFRWSILVLLLQTGALLCGVLSGELRQVAIASACTGALFLPLSYLLLVRPLVGPCLRSLAGATIPAALMTAAMVVIVEYAHLLIAPVSEGSSARAYGALFAEVVLGVVVYGLLFRISRRRQFEELLQLIKGRAAVRAPFSLDEQGHPSWWLRAARAREFLDDARAERPVRTIADFGCGDQKLRVLLDADSDASIDYQGFDLHPQSAEVTRLDLERGLPPGRFDMVFMLGVAEYVGDIRTLLHRLGGIADFVCFSYTVADSGAYDASAVASKAWRHHHSIADLEAMASESGLQKRRFVLLDEGRIGLWLWRTGGRD